MSIFVVNYETTEGTTIVGAYMSEKLARTGAKDYMEKLENMKKQSTKRENGGVVLYKSKNDENSTSIVMHTVDFEIPTKNKKKNKDPNAPKKPLSAYMFYANEHRVRVKNENDGVTFGEIGKILGSEWKQLNETQKETYVQKAEEDKKRYETAIGLNN